MRFGLSLPQYDFSLARPGRAEWGWISEWAHKAEDLGYDSVWLSDHLFFSIGRYGGPPEPQWAMECFTGLAALAASTQRVRLGSLVVCNDLRPPPLVAQMAATIDAISNGRLDLGIGAGWNEPEYQVAGIPFERAGVRVSRLEESIQIIKGMLANENFSFEGKQYSVPEVSHTLRATQRPNPPIFVGGKGDRIVRIAGRHADGFNTVWAWTPEAYRERAEAVRRAARDAGRDPESVKLSVGLYVVVGRDDAELDAAWAAYKNNSPAGIAPAMSLDEWGADKLCGTPEQIASRVNQFEAIGVEEVILSFGLLPFQIADEGSVEMFAREVFPLVAS